MTAPRHWPNNADAARLDSIALAELIDRQIAPLLDALERDKSVNAMQLLLTLTKISRAAAKIKIELLEVGRNKFLD